MCLRRNEGLTLAAARSALSRVASARNVASWVLSCAISRRLELQSHASRVAVARGAVRHAERRWLRRAALSAGAAADGANEFNHDGGLYRM